MVLFEVYNRPEIMEIDGSPACTDPQLVQTINASGSCGGASDASPNGGGLSTLVTLKKCVQKVTCCLKKNRDAKLERALLKSLHKAKSQYRLKLGICSSLRILELEPNSVVICILPILDTNKDSLSHMQLLLIEAYCHEHEIRILKVHSPENIYDIVKHDNETDIESEAGGSDDEDDECGKDDSIVLIIRSHYPSPADDELLALYDEQYKRGSSSPEITSQGGEIKTWM